MLWSFKNHRNVILMFMWIKNGLWTQPNYFQLQFLYILVQKKSDFCFQKPCICHNIKRSLSISSPQDDSFEHCACSVTILKLPIFIFMFITPNHTLPVAAAAAHVITYTYEPDRHNHMDRRIVNLANRTPVGHDPGRTDGWRAWINE